MVSLDILMMTILIGLIIFNTIANKNEENKKIYLVEFPEKNEEFYISKLNLYIQSFYFKIDSVQFFQSCFLFATCLIIFLFGMKIIM